VLQSSGAKPTPPYLQTNLGLQRAKKKITEKIKKYQKGKFDGRPQVVR